uniref:serine/threonine-protein kinase pim-1-like n=1 Tax=Monopterus albus TaxID=43700 RepID=UPI0009B4E86B|nr:serine/threonine-protein kinase pim-1-like [Monopterus albus]
MEGDSYQEFQTLDRNSSTEPCGVSVQTRTMKRKANTDGFRPEKRMCIFKSAFEHRRGRKRKVPANEENIRKRQRTSETEKHIGRLKRKATENEDKPKERQKVSKLNQREEDTTSSSLDAALPQKRDKNNMSTSEETRKLAFEAKYQQLSPLGEGGHGSVYAGYRRADHFPVAIKHIPRDNIICKGLTQNRKTISLEVAVMKKMASGAAGSVRKSAAISLLDNYDLEQELILVLERPLPSNDLCKYIEVKGGSLQEEEAKLFLKQLIEAAMELQAKKVFHRDIKLENILVETGSNVPRLRLIDFGLSCFTKKTSSYKTFFGTDAHIPPEWYQCYIYRAESTTVWQLGVVLYDMLHRDTRFETTRFLSSQLGISKELSQGCQQMLRLCLAVDPQQRPSLEQLWLHPWLA